MAEPDPDDPFLRELLGRLPHGGEARLPSRVTGFAAGRSVSAERDLSSGDPCLNSEGWLPGALIVEMMAQTGGFLIGHEADAAPGTTLAVLAGLKRMHIHGSARAGETVTVVCELLRRIGDVYLMEGRTFSGPRLLAHGLFQLKRVRTDA